MGLVRQLLIVALLCGLGVAAYRYGWPLIDRQVVAPFDGFTGLTDIDDGDRIDTDDGITTLDDRSSLLVGFSVPELFLGRVGKGHPVEVAAWAARDRPIPGEIVDLDSRSFIRSHAPARELFGTI